MKILIATGFNKNMAESKIKPLVALPEVERIYYVADKPGPFFEKVEYYCIPQVLLRVFNYNSIIRASLKFFMVLYLSLYKRPDFLMGYTFIPHVINVVLVAKLLDIPVCMNLIGGSLGVMGGGIGGGKGNIQRSISNICERLLRWIADICDLVIVTGTSTKNLLISRGVEKDKISIISAVVDTKRFLPGVVKKQYDIITVAELIPRKRIDIFLKIVYRLVRENIPLKAVIVGDGILRKDLEALSRRLGLEDVVEFKGFDPKVEYYLLRAKIFLFPTRNEGLSLAMLEAMACGVIPVVSDVDDLHDAVENGVNGVLVDKDDMDGFVSAVSDLLRDGMRRRHYAQNAIQTIRDKFSVECAAEKWRSILNNIRPARGVIHWYFNRLKAMSVLEIGYRVLCIFRRKILRLNSMMIKNKDFLKPDVHTKIKFYIEERDLNFIKERFKAIMHTKGLDSIRDIDRYTDQMLEDDVNNRDMNIGYRAGVLKIDLKPVFELNRFQWLVNYAQIYALDKHEELAVKIVNILENWIDRNPVLKGINWSDTFEISLRLLSWSWVYFLIKDAAVFDKYFENRFLRSIYFQGRAIEWSLSRFSSANNHLITEGSALFIIGILFPQLNCSGRWVRRGKRILEEEIERQVYPDGTAKEQSINYHVFIIELYLAAIIIGMKNGIIFSDKVKKRLEKMCEFLMHIVDEKGNMPSIGDSDDSCAFMLNIFEEWRSKVTLLNTASVIFKRPDFKQGLEIDEESLWRLGLDGRREYLSLQGERQDIDSICFPQGGYCIMKDKDLFITFDCGDLGYLSPAAHGHADALSITLTYAGSPILVDPGTYLYHSGGRWRNYFRSTRAHNTISIDELDQSEILGPFLWGYKAKAALEYWSLNGGCDRVCGYHTGYTRLKDPVIHRRDITFYKQKKEIVIKDSLLSRKEHLVDIFFHLHPDCNTEKLNNDTYRISNGKSVVLIKLDRSLKTYIYKGEEEPICGWYSERFGKKIKTSTICARGYFKGDKEFVTYISIMDKNRGVR